MNKHRWKRRGILCVVSGPSGSGKTTLCQRFSREDPDAAYAISATTRDPREGEKDGTDYYFLSREEFKMRVENGEFLEHAEVHGQLYGTLKSEVLSHIENGRDVLMDIDVQGAALIRLVDDQLITHSLTDIFILPPSDDELMNRLSQRNTETQEQLALRLQNAREEMRHWPDYRYLILSADKESDFAIFSSIIHGERCRTSRLLPPDE